MYCITAPRYNKLMEHVKTIDLRELFGGNLKKKEKVNGFRYLTELLPSLAFFNYYFRATNREEVVAV